MNKDKVLITGGAGFIGSNLVDKLLKNDNIELVRVFDNLATGSINNIAHNFSNPRFEFIEGDIRNFKDCNNAMEDITVVSHQAALGSVPRSIKDPITTNDVNISGTLNILFAAKEHKVRRIVYAASSSTYGDSTQLPKREDIIGNPLSPYAVTKLVNEQYASVFAKVYNMQLIGLRYFNVFGPRQSPYGEYAAVIPLFINAISNGEAFTINGDGSQSRDFTFISNVVSANIKALFNQNIEIVNKVFNIACGESTSLIRLVEILEKISKKEAKVNFGPERIGDVKHSLADISRARDILSYEAAIGIEEGLEITYNWFNELNKSYVWD